MTSAADGTSPWQEVDPAGLSVPALRALRAELLAREARVSYWRQLVLARVDQFARGQPPVVTAESLAPMLRSLAGASARGGRLTVATPAPWADDVDLRSLWDQVLDPLDPEGVERARATFEAVERRLSAERRQLHRRLDAATAELVARYREDPMRALEVLPEPS